MPRSPRDDEPGGIYHAFNHANMDAPIFKKEGDFFAFQRVLYEALVRYRVELYSYQLMTNHWHLIVRPSIDREMGRFQSFPIQDDELFLVAYR